MEKHIYKPQIKDEGMSIKEEYPDKVQMSYQWICEHLNDVQIGDLNDLADKIYKVAYLDGFKDALYFKEI